MSEKHNLLSDIKIFVFNNCNAKIAKDHTAPYNHTLPSTLFYTEYFYDVFFFLCSGKALCVNKLLLQQSFHHLLKEL